MASYTLRTEKDLKRVALLTGNLIAYDIETSGLNPRSNKTLIIALSDGETDLAIDCTRISPAIAYRAVEQASRGKLLLGHNIVFDWKFAFRHGVALGAMHDSMICERLLTAGLLVPQGFSLKAVVEKYCGVVLSKDVRNEFIDNPDITLEDRHFAYALDDVRYLFAIYEKQMEAVRKHKLDAVYQLEMDLLPCTALMEYTGIGIDRAQLESLIPIFTNLVEKSNKALQDLFIAHGAVKHILVTKDGYSGINTNSRPQVIAALQTLGVTIPSLNAKEVLKWDITNTKGNSYNYHEFLGLEDDDSLGDAIDLYIGLSNPYLRALSFLTAARKLLGSYVIGTLEKIDPNTKRVHGWFSQLGARSTGRYSSDLQQIPQDGKLERLSINQSIRGCFVSQPNCSFLIADYSGIELVILADRSGDEVLGNIIVERAAGRDDIHLYVVRQSLATLHPDAITATIATKDTFSVKLLRKGAKRVSFAIAYGVTGVALSEQLTIDLAPLNVTVNRDQGNTILTGWKQKAFVKSGTWLDSFAYMALSKGYTTSALGRKRWYDLEFAAQQKWKRFAIGREGSNHGIQATSADMTKRAMLYTYRRLDRNKARIIWTVHDELVLEVQDLYAAQASAILKEEMERAAQELLPYMGQHVKVKVSQSKCYDK